jgi:hypothetical protein
MISALYLIILGAISWHLYQAPLYRMDSLQYMGNALLIENTDIVQIHQRVYYEIQQSVPEPERDYLLGRQPDAPADQNISRASRSRDPYRFGEFLPFFAIRPLYNQLIYLLHAAGIGLMRSTILISCVAYFCLGVVLFVWIRSYSTPLIAIVLSTLVMLSSPMTTIGRENISDALATLVAFTGIFLICEKENLTPGMIVLLTSIYFRTDFVVLAIPLLISCWLKRRTTFWQTAVLAALAGGAVLLINYFAGDYGIKMLYYRNFVGTPSAPAEMTVLFSFRDYLSGLRRGITLAADSFFFPFLLIGVTGLLCAPRSRTIFSISLSYAGLHFLLLPNWEERWFVLFYLSMGVVAAMGLGSRQHRPAFFPNTMAADSTRWTLAATNKDYAESVSGLAAEV